MKLPANLIYLTNRKLSVISLINYTLSIFEELVSGNKFKMFNPIFVCLNKILQIMLYIFNAPRSSCGISNGNSYYILVLIKLHF